VPEDLEEQLLAQFQQGTDDLNAAVRSFRETGQRGPLAGVATVAFSFLELHDEAPSPHDASLAGVAATWFQVASEAWSRPELLSLAIDLGRAATGTERPPGRPLAMHLTNLAHALMRTWEVYGEDAFVVEAVEVLRRALASTDDDDPDLPEILSSLGSTLAQGEDVGLIADLAEAVQLLKRAVELTAETSPGRAGLVNNLAVVLRRLAERDGQAAHLDLAIGHYEAILAAEPDLRTRQAALNGLAITLHERFVLDHRDETLARAVTEQRRCVELTAFDDVERPGRKSNLGGLLIELARVSGNDDALAEGFALLTNLYDAAPSQGVERANRAHHLANALHTRAERFGETADLRRAAKLRRESVALMPNTSPAYPGAIRDLAKTLLRIDELEPDGALVRDAIGLLDEAWERGSDIDPLGAIDAGRGLLNLYERVGEPALAAEAGKAVLELARKVAVAQAGLSTRRSLLERLDGVASRTAVALAATGDDEEAAVVLESGRAVLFAEQIRLSAASPTGGELDTALAVARRLVASAEPGTPRERLEALAVIRAHGDSEPPSYPGEDIAAASRLRPLLYIAAGADRGIALFVRNGETVGFSCEGLTRDCARGLLERQAAVIDGLRHGGRINDLDDELQRIVEELRATLPQSLKDEIAAAGTISVIASDDLAGLPTHLMADPTETVVALALSAGTLLWNARHPMSRKLTPHVVCAITKGPDRAPAADVERARALGRGDHVLDLSDEHATREAVLDAAHVAGCLQIACHGRSEPWDPLASSLTLWDGHLRAADLLSRPVGSGRLAVLTACESSMTELSLPDEAAGLPSAFLQSGFGGVIGSAWPLPGAVAAYFSDQLNCALFDLGATPTDAFRSAISATASATMSELVGWIGKRAAKGDYALRTTAPEVRQATDASAPTVPLISWAGLRYFGW
jgi:tetratricopeptide (TPR) repeat protein